MAESDPAKGAALLAMALLSVQDTDKPSGLYCKFSLACD